MNVVPVDNSTNIRGIGYDPATKTLAVQFHSGPTYLHYGVEQDAFNALMSAKSKGSHYHQNIKGAYRTEQMPEETQGSA